MIEKLKDFWSIFKNSKNEFYKDKNEAIKLLEIVKYIKILTSTAYEKNKEILDYLDSNIYNYPNYMFDCISNLISMLKYEYNSNDYNFIYVIFNIKLECSNTYCYMNKQFKQRKFKDMKEEYINLIKNLRDYEKKYKIGILDNFYDYDKI